MEEKSGFRNLFLGRAWIAVSFSHFLRGTGRRSRSESAANNKLLNSSGSSCCRRRGGDGARVSVCAERSLHKRKVWVHTTDKKRSPYSRFPKPRSDRGDLALRQSELEGEMAGGDDT